MNLRKKIIIAASCIVAIIVALLVINKIATAPQKLPAAPQPQPVIIQISAPESPAVAVPAVKELPLEKEYPKQVMIGLRSWSDVESAQKIIIDNGGRVIKTLKWPTKNVIVAVLPDKESEERILKNSFWGKLIGGIGFTSFGNKLSGGIDYVEKDVKVPLQAINSVDWGVTHIKADRVWSVATGKGVKVAVIDTGIQRDHPDLVANIKGGISFMPGGPDQLDDENGHGTEVAGLIGAVNNDIGYVGVAPEVSLYAVKVMGKNGLADTSDMISGIYWAADNGMDVANLSLGIYLDPKIYAHTIAEETAAANYAYERGVVLVASSGNSLTEGCDRVTYPAAISSYVVAVGATLPDNNIAYFSCHGPEVELVAPGFYNWAPGLGGSYGPHTGTSVSAPFVAGVAALVLSKNPEFTPAQVRERLDSAAVDLGAPGRDDYYGYGLVNAYDSIFPSALPAVINLISPKGGEQWWQGTDQEVRWSMNNAPSGEEVKVDIQLVHNATEMIPLALNEINDGLVSVNVPSGLPVSGAADSYYLRVSCSKLFVGKCQPAKSGALNILAVPPQSLKVISPNGGEKWPQGTTQSVFWTANYFDGTNINIDLWKKISVLQYLFSGVSQTSACFNPSAFTCLPSAKLVSLNHISEGNRIDFGGGNYADQDFPFPRPQDTCNGNINKWTEGGAFSCPAENSTGNFTCTDVMQHKDYNWYWYARTVTCSYANKNQTGSIDKLEPVTALAQNVLNKGLADITVPSDVSGDGYLIQLSCANFTGECSKGLSANPFSIVRLADPVALTINKLGAGVVTDSNIICGSNRNDCLENYERGTAITLSAVSADPTAIFTGWSGACSGTGTCQITMDGDQSVTATFSIRSVTLTAAADPGSIFTGWSGACSGTGTCQVTKDESVTATFVKSSKSCAWTCSDWSPATCANGSTQIRSCVLSACPPGVTAPLKPATSRPCGTPPPCTADTWSCSPFPDECPLSGEKTQTCIMTFDCPSVDTPNPAASQSCAPEFIPGKLKEVKP